jgi:hypothetical protein
MEELSSFYHLAREFAVSTHRSMFITGKAGTGKTTFLHNLKKQTRKQMAIVAPTGVAAINAGGTTMHSFFQLPFTPFIPNQQGRKELTDKIKMQGNRRKVIQELELLVIDEISMVRADVLDAVDTILRHIRYKHNEPFGGVQVIFIGDLFQLSPVANENEWQILSQYYTSPYFFHSQVITQQKPIYLELDKIFRQSNADFIRILNEVRNNNLTTSGLELLHSRYNPFFTAPKDDTYITLTTHNYKADKINAEELIQIKTKTQTLKAEIEGEFPEKGFPTDKELNLKVGAKVMFIKNDQETPRRFFNGKIGVIESITDKIITINCPGDAEVIELGRMIWENIKYSTNEKTKQIEERVIGTFTQFPLRLAWAITIHKSQGLTFDKAIIDAGDAFASGQVYVALSRCRTLEGMILLSKINPYSIENDREIVQYEQNKLPVEFLEQELRNSLNEFRVIVLNELFDFRMGIGHCSRWMRTIEASVESYNKETVPFSKVVLKQLQDIQEVADKFRHQLETILKQQLINEDFLSERLEAAKKFFVEKLQTLLETLKESPAVTESRENARDYNEQILSIFSFIAQKHHLLQGLKHPFSTENYFDRKNTFLLPDFKVNAYSKHVNTKTLNTKNPSLYFKLAALRNELCEPEDLPVYVVAKNTTLIEMADYLPLTENDLLKIDGFGPVKVGRYGSQFLKIIKSYASENGLTSKMDEKKDSKQDSQKEKKEKKPKGDSHRLTFEMYKQGKTIQEIATERNLATTTISSHLSVYTNSGQLDINDFISEEKRIKAMAIFEKNKDADGSVYQLFDGVLNREEISFFLSWKRNS